MPADRPRVIGVHHVQITVPIGAEDEARAYYVGVLGLEEIPKPASLAGRGGLWLTAGAIELHIGVEDGVDRRLTKAHVAFEVTDLAECRRMLEAAGFFVESGVPIPHVDRFETRDPFRNRIEFVAQQPH